MSDVKARLVRLGLDHNRPFDAAIYGKNQKLRMVGSLKTPQDTRVLRLLAPDGSFAEPERPPPCSTPSPRSSTTNGHSSRSPRHSATRWEHCRPNLPCCLHHVNLYRS